MERIDPALARFIAGFGPWGQTVSRRLSPEGLLLGISFTPALRDNPDAR